MNHSLLRSWLGLEPGPWPLNHYSLLGLSPGRCNPATVELVVLAQMDRLRPHQLLHPELVTEGMNRLAQALICLTDPSARAAYDAELGLVSERSPSVHVAVGREKITHLPTTKDTSEEPLPVFQPIPGFSTTSDEPEPTSTDATQVIDVRYVSGLEPPEVLPPAYEVVDSEIGEPLPPAFELVGESENANSVAFHNAFKSKHVSPQERHWQPKTRRALFGRLTAVRRLHAAWKKLKPLLGNAHEPIDRPVCVLSLLEAVSEVCPLLDTVPGIAGKLDQPGGLVALLIRQPLLLHIIRALLPDQRKVIAADWLRADSEMTRDSNRLRELARTGRKVRSRSRTWSRLRRVARWVARTPEVGLISLAVATMLLALLRGFLDR